VDVWEGVPAASEDYAAARDALRERLATLLDALSAASPSRWPRSE
jgi:hypothetical protein